MPGYLDVPSNIEFGWTVGEDGWGPAMNRSLRQLAYVGGTRSVKNRTTATPPSAPTAGDKYIVAANPTGAWSTYNVGDIAVWGRGLTAPATLAWQRFQPARNLLLYDEGADQIIKYNGTEWGTIGGGERNVQSDWNQTDMSADDYIKNKPNISTGTLWTTRLVDTFTGTLTRGGASQSKTVLQARLGTNARNAALMNTTGTTRWKIIAVFDITSLTFTTAVARNTSMQIASQTPQGSSISTKSFSSATGAQTLDIVRGSGNYQNEFDVRVSISLLGGPATSEFTIGYRVIGGLISG